MRAADPEITIGENARDAFEARGAAGLAWLDEWRRQADDPHNPDNWA
ncbi:hypothetical protein RAZWK3B_03210 [Roseobacter sp. AzwK-3b]|nr:hypothetical protein RAZWK3B_03210 [Roseobacter sp. AzwK-3b]